MSLQSTVPAVIDKLLALFQQATASDTTVVISDGFPAAQSQQAIIAVGGTQAQTVQGTTEQAAFGVHAVVEDYTVEVIVSCYAGGADQKSARDHAYALFDACVQAVYADNTLGLGTAFSCVLDRHELKQTDVQDALKGRVAEITAYFRVTAILEA